MASAFPAYGACQHRIHATARAGIFQEIATAPFALTVHSILGLALIGTAIVLAVRAAACGTGLLARLAAVGLTAIGGAFGAGRSSSATVSRAPR
jgi:hypothetical protein